MRFWVAGRNLFRNVRRDSRVVHEDVNWPAINLARWFVRCWPALFHGGSWSSWIRPALTRNARDLAVVIDQELVENFDLPDSMFDARDNFVRSHSLRAAAAGAALPDVWLSRDEGRVSVAWNDSMDGEIFFTLSRGEADVPDAEFAESVRGFVRWVRDLLPENSEDHRLLDSWLRSFGSKEAALAALEQETRLGGGVWQDVAAAGGVVADSIADFLAIPPSRLSQGTLISARASSLALAFRCASPTLSLDELAHIRDTFLTTPRSEAGFDELSKLAEAVSPPPDDTYDFVRGYALAREVRRVLGNRSEPLDIESLLRDLQVPIVALPLSDGELDGGCVCDEEHGPAVFVNPKSARATTPWGRRMVLAHELCHLLFDRSIAVELGAISGPWAPPRIERAANAFAIELLLPLEGVLQEVGAVWKGFNDEQVQRLMDRYSLGLTAVTEHLRNLSHPRNR